MSYGFNGTIQISGNLTGTNPSSSAKETVVPVHPNSTNGNSNSQATTASSSSANSTNTVVPQPVPLNSVYSNGVPNMINRN